jgi:hypothetical protein
MAGRAQDRMQAMDDQKADAQRVMKLKLIGIVIAIVILIPILAWKWGFF